MSAPPTTRAPHRLLALAVVCALLAFAGVGNALVRARHRVEAAVRAGPDAAVSLAGRVTSSAWYCAGPLAVGAGAPPAAVLLANATGRVVRGELVVTTTAGAVSRQAVHVGARAAASYALASGGPRREAAATVLLDGSGIGVEEVSYPPPDSAGKALLLAPCASHVSAVAYLAAGGSRGADHLSLSLFDPGATPAVANVSFATSAGAVSPAAFQGVTVGAGQLVVLDVSRAVPGRAMIATSVQATGGEIVAGGLNSAARGHGVESALLPASSSPSSSWSFPPAPAGPDTAEAFAVYDPGQRPASVALETIGTGGPTTTTATVPAGGVLALATGSVSRAGALRAATVVVRSGPPVAVARELVLEKPLAAARALLATTRVVTVRHGSRHTSRRVSAVRAVEGGTGEPTLLPALPAGYSVGVGARAAARTWLLPLGGVATSAVLAVSDPGAAPALVRVTPLGSTMATARFHVPAGGVATFDLAGAGRLATGSGVRLDASEPVVAGLLLSPSSTKAVGLTSVVGLPVSP